MFATFVLALYPCYVCIETTPACGSTSQVTTQTEAMIPSNRNRTKLGVGERTAVTLSPAPNCTVTWSVAGGGTVSPTSGSSTTFTAGDRASSSTVTATMEGNYKGIAYTIVEPAGVIIEQKQGTGIWHVQGTASAGFRGQPYFTPEDVSFMNIEVTEGSVAGVGTGYYAIDNGLNHPEWGFYIAVVPGTSAHPSKMDGFDEVETGIGPPPFANGTFTWSIPWLFKVGNGAAKQFAVVNHAQQADTAGRATISKGGFSVSRNASDATSAY